MVCTHRYVDNTHQGISSLTITLKSRYTKRGLEWSNTPDIVSSKRSSYLNYLIRIYIGFSK